MRKIGSFATVICLMSAFCIAQKIEQVCGAPIFSKDTHGNPDVVVCPSDTPNECKISLSFLKCLSVSGDPAIRVNRNDKIEWYSDQKDKNGNLIVFKFEPFRQVGPNKHEKCSAPGGHDQEPFPDAHGNGYAFRYIEHVHAMSVRKSCFEHVLKLRDTTHTGEYDFDPHVIIGDGTEYLSKEAYAWFKPNKATSH
jgi:hypothetical protein